MKIGLVTDTYLPDINGVVSSTVILKKALEKRGHKVYVITNHAGSKIELDNDILRLPGIKLKSLYGYKMSSPINVGATDYIRSLDLDVLHLQTNFGVGIYGSYLAKAIGIPLVDTYHTMYEDYTHYINPMGFNGVEKVSREAIRAVSRKVCNSVQAVVAPSEKTKEALIQYGVIAPIYVVPTGLNLDQFLQAGNDPKAIAQIRAQVTDDPEAVILVFVGRLAKEKSLEMVIEAVSKSPDEHFHLAIVGAGPDEDYYEKLTDSLHAREHVHFLGKAMPDEVAKYYAAFDAFVSASLSETQGMTYLEALASGRMVFGRRDEVLDNLIDEGETGYYFDSSDELLKKLEQFKALTPEQREECQKECRQKTAAFTDEAFAYTMETVYSQAIEDYSRTFEVTKIRLEGDFAFLELERDSDPTPVKVMVPLEEYFEQKISPHSLLDSYMVSSWLDQMDFYYAFYKSKNRVLEKDMSRAQVIAYCTGRLKTSVAVAQQVADELESRNLIDDEKFAMEKAQYWQQTGLGKSQIGKKLRQAGISGELTGQAMDSLEDSLETKNAKALAVRLARTLKTQSSGKKRQTIISRLVSRGYSPEAAREAAEELDFDTEEDLDALQAAYKKACRLYASRPEKERRQKIRLYCLRQGFNGGDIDTVMEGEMDND